MVHKFLSNTKFHQFLILLDDNLADEIRQNGCLHCEDELNSSDYPRSPFGVSTAFREFYRSRRSFCCRRCRRRTTPPSVRFFNQRWYCAPFFILISALMSKSRKRQLKALQKHLGLTVNKRTLLRWRIWWQTYFPTTPFWKQMKALTPHQVINGPFPWSILNTYSGQLKEKIIQLLRFLTLITVVNLQAV